MTNTLKLHNITLVFSLFQCFFCTFAAEKINKNMKILAKLLVAIVVVCSIAACNDTETYADKKETEKKAIAQFISDSSITVISEEQFETQGYTTDISKNEYVLFADDGVYMQIVNAGCGEKIKSGETVTMLCRFREYNIEEDTVTIYNDDNYFARSADNISVTKTSGSYTASFISGWFSSSYSTTTVPTGWLIPLDYIKIGRPSGDDEDVARVKLILPHGQVGTTVASTYVYPYFYTISYERGI